MKVSAATPEDFGWLYRRIGCPITLAFRAIKATDASGRIRGMVGYDGWTENAVHAHMAVDAPIVWRSLIRPAFAYPFEEAKRGVIIGTVAASNAASLKMVVALGFEMLTRIYDGFALGVDLLVFEMRKENCRWLQQPLRKVA